MEPTVFAVAAAMLQIKTQLHVQKYLTFSSLIACEQQDTLRYR